MATSNVILANDMDFANVEKAEGLCWKKKKLSTIYMKKARKQFFTQKLQVNVTACFQIKTTHNYNLCCVLSEVYILSFK